MLKNYLAVALRGLRRRRGATAINVLGMALGVACCLSAYAFVQHELGFDAYHAQAERTYRIGALWHDWIGDGPSYQEQTPTGLVPLLRDGVPGIERLAELQVTFGPRSVKADGAFFEQDRRAYVGPAFFEVFDYAVRTGDLAGLAAPATVALTETTARRYFGDGDAVGATLRHGDTQELTVVAVVADSPAATHLPFTFFVSFTTLDEPYDEWGFSDGHSVYVVLEPGAAPAAVEQQLNALRIAHQTPEERAEQAFLLQPVRAIHTAVAYGAYPGSYVMDPAYLWGFGVLSLLILLSAAVNYVNLATAQGAARAHEVGVRKALGGTRLQIAAQLAGEAGLMAFAAAALGWLVAYETLPLVAALFEIDLARELLRRPTALLFTSGVALVVGALAGLYPAVLLSRHQPVHTLRGTVSLRGGTGLRRGLVVFQFAATQALVLGALVVVSQMRYVQEKDLGFEREARLLVRVPDGEAGRVRFREALRQAPAVRHVTYAMGGPTRGGLLSQQYDWPGAPEGEAQKLRTLAIDAGYLDTFGLGLLAGRDLQPRDGVGPRGRAALVNRTMAEHMGFARPSDALGATLDGRHWEDEAYTLEIVGVVEDFHHGSLRSAIDPVVMQYWPRWTHQAGIALDPDRLGEGLAQAEAAFAATFPDTHFRYAFFDDYLASLYETERRLAQAFRLFTGLAALIAGLGLFGLAALTTAQRTKEVGVRKVLGASVASLVALFSKEFAALILVAFACTAPLAALLMRRWLDGFASASTSAPASSCSSVPSGSGSGCSPSVRM